MGKVKVGPVQLSRWSGPAYRVDSGYSSRYSAAEEASLFISQQDEKLPWHKTLEALIPYLRLIPSREMFWVTKKKSDAVQYRDRYGAEIEKFDLPHGAIIGADGEGGYLVIRDVRKLPK